METVEVVPRYALERRAFGRIGHLHERKPAAAGYESATVNLSAKGNIMTI
jgi:hypothetical protein